MQILKSQYIFDVETETTFPGIVVLENEKISHVLPASESEAWLAKTTDVIDYGEQMLIPGFIDAHVHFFMTSLIQAKKVHPLITSSEESYAEAASKLPSFQDWTVAIGWYSSDWDVDRLPTKASLDRYFSDRPCAMVAGDVHTLWLNSAAMERLNITLETLPAGVGGEAQIIDGELTGVFFEALGVYFLDKILKDYREDSVADFLDLMKIQNAMGITSCGDVAGTGDSGNDQIFPEIYQAVEATGQATLRMHLFPAMREETERIEKMEKELTSSYLKFSGVKQFFDGVTSTKTAFMIDEYPNPAFPGEVGGPLIPIEQMREFILKANQNDWPMRIHVVGDRATQLSLDYFAESFAKHPLSAGKYNTLEHLECVTPTDFERLDQPQLVLSVQPSHTLVGYDSLVDEVGPERMPYMFAYQTFLQKGALLGFGTDTPVVLDVTPIESIYYAVYRQTLEGNPIEGVNASESLSIAQGLAAHTLGAAQAVSRTDLGKISPGAYADITILDHNILNDSKAELLATKVVSTWIGGKEVYRAQ